MANYEVEVNDHLQRTHIVQEVKGFRIDGNLLVFTDEQDRDFAWFSMYNVITWYPTWKKK